MNENKINKNQETKNDEKIVKGAVDDHAVIGDNAALVGVSNVAKVNLVSGQLLVA